MENSNIIADFLDINKDISLFGFGKKFKLYYSIKKKIYRKKLIKRIEKFRNSGIIISKDNLYELLSYIYTNYMPDGAYKNIQKTAYYPISREYSALFFKEDKYKYTVSANQIDKKIKITISTIKIMEDSRGYTLELEKLSTNNREISDHINYINSVIRETICDYILDIVTLYNGKENEI